MIPEKQVAESFGMNLTNLKHKSYDARMKKFLCALIAFLCSYQLVYATSLTEELQRSGYVEICGRKHGSFDALYDHFDDLIEFLQTNPNWAHKLFVAKERFIRSKDRNHYSTDFFGFFDESGRVDRCQIAFYYSTHFHEFIRSQFKDVPVIREFLEACQETQNSFGSLYDEVAEELNLDQPPILFKVIKYFPAYVASRPHYDGTAFSIFLDSTDNESLLLAPYKSLMAVDDFFAPERSENSVLLIPGAYLTEFSIFPTPHIVVQSGKVRYSTIAFAMRPNYTPQKIEFSTLPNFRD